MDTLLLVAGATLIIVVGLGALAALLVFLIPGLRRPAAPETDPAEAQLAELARLQTEATGRVQAMSEMLAARQGELARLVHDRLDAVSQNLGQSMQTSQKQTTENLARLNERLAVIDTAQKNITDLASQVTTLQSVLTNKQQRGAFGQGRMEIIVQDGLPKDCYEFQYTLTNRSRPDCCIIMPDKRPLVIDAKFPLEAITAFREAKNDEERKLAAARLRQDVGKHVVDIAQKYLIPGETQDLAMMFVPSESVYAELHDGFDDIVQKAYRAKVIIVSPSLLMLAIHVIQQIQKDARMRDAADKIHAEVGYLMEDLRRLQARTEKLRTHFNQANEDLKQLETSAEKIETRGKRISEVEFGEDEGSAEIIPGPMTLKLGSGG